MIEVVEVWVSVVCEVKGIVVGSKVFLEEWMGGLMVM